jgi:uncharacterized protein (DUF1501 family)
MNRRNFMMGCSSAIAAMAGAQITSVTFANPSETADVLVVVFLRGAWDAINVTPPLDGPDRAAYEAARPYLKVPIKGKNAALALNNQFGLHPALAPLHELYQSKHLAIVQATGMASDTRSHFDAMQFMELGTPGERGTNTGWIARHLQASPESSGLQLPALSIDGATAPSLLGSPEAAAMRDPKSFLLVDDTDHRKRLTGLIENLYKGDSWLHAAGQRTLATIRTVERMKLGDYRPAVPYPESDFAGKLKTIASLLKQGLSMRVATVDLGGWDTHDWQGEGGEGYFAELLGQLGDGLAAFYHDLEAANLTKRINVVVMSEFGRRLAENGARGTDHGHGSAMLVLGGNVNGGKLYGKWPGLQADQLYDRADLAVTTDYRAVISEVLRFRMKNDQLGVVFPGFKLGQPMGLVQSI